MIPIATVSSAMSAAISRRSSRATWFRNSTASATRNISPTSTNAVSWTPRRAGPSPSHVNDALSAVSPNIPSPSHGALCQASRCLERKRITTVDRRHEIATIGRSEVPADAVSEAM